jgi:hypothetical protein
MPDIGASLREARMRAHIDITEAEADTKIRGKYLRALENEEWRLLPGPTFVRSFLRTYGDYLGLDGRLLAEDFKLRYEQGEGELQPIAKGHSGEGGRRSAPRSPKAAARGRALVVGGLLALLLAGLFALGRGGDDEPAGTDGEGDRPAAAEGVATLRIQPTRAVYACVRAADGRILLDAVLQPSAAGRELRSRRLRLTLGSGDARLVVNGEPRTIPAGDRALGYDITTSGMRRLGAARRPRCS